MAHLPKGILVFALLPTSKKGRIVKRSFASMEAGLMHCGARNRCPFITAEVDAFVSDVLDIQLASLTLTLTIIETEATERFWFVSPRNVSTDIKGGSDQSKRQTTGDKNLSLIHVRLLSLVPVLL
jgi:hypothetical protein